jgi:hypothetical protein
MGLVSREYLILIPYTRNKSYANPHIWDFMSVWTLAVYGV